MSESVDYILLFDIIEIQACVFNFLIMIKTSTGIFLI